MTIFVLVLIMAAVMSPGLIGALAGAAIGAYGAKKSADAQKSSNNMNWNLLAEALGFLGWHGVNTYTPPNDPTQPKFTTAFGLLDNRFRGAQKHLERGAAGLLSGAQGAARAVNRTGAGAQRNIMRAGTQSLAQQRAGLGQAGLLNSSIGTQLARANRADTARQTTDLASALAPIRAQAQMGIGQARFAGQSALAGLQQNRAQMETQLATQRLNALLGVNISPGSSFLEQLGGGKGLAALGNMFGKAWDSFKED